VVEASVKSDDLTIPTREVELSSVGKVEKEVEVKEIRHLKEISAAVTKSKTLVVVRPRGKYWSAWDYITEIAEAFEVRSYEVELVSVIKVRRNIDLLFWVDDTIFVGEGG